ncbi:hypothetical protein BJX70DRAFT_114862 [Aspergillus crustosus]
MPPRLRDSPQDKFVFVGGPTLNERSGNVRSILLRRVLSEKKIKRRQDAADRLDSMLNQQAQEQATLASTSLCTCGISTEQNAVLSDLSIEATGYPLIKPRKKQNRQNIRLHSSQEHCSTCGGLVAGQHLYLPSPELFGAGRCDRILPVDAPTARLKIHELLDFTTTTIWTRFRNLDYPTKCYREWVLPFENDLQLYAVLWASSYHRDIMRVTSGAFEPKLDSKDQLELRLLALRALQREIANVSNTTSPDSLVMCILFLAVNDKHKAKITRDASPFSPPFVSLQVLDFYGSRDYHLLHWNMLHDIVRRFGGIDRLRAFALPWLLTLAALMRSAQTLTKPIYPIVGIAGKPLDLQPPSLLFQPHGYRDPLDLAGSGFHELFTMWPPVKQEVVQPLIHLGQFSQVVQHYSSGACSPVVLDLLGDCRNLVHHRLLSLPNEYDPTASYLEYTEEDNDENELSREIYLTAHLTAVLFALHVTFPLPRNIQNRQIIIDALWVRYDRLSELKASGPMVLWCIAVAVSMLGEDSRESLISYMARLLEDAGVHSVKDLADVLRIFAWVDAAVPDSLVDFWTRKFFSPRHQS